MTPAPIPIRWSLSDLDVAGPVVAAVGAPNVPPAFRPLPGHTTITEGDLRAGGGRRELHQLFVRLASGRIVVVGAPGAGKSGAAILLLLDAVAHRDSLDDTERARVPVPVLFTGHGWDPNITSVQDWLRDRLVATYPLFQRRGGDADAAALVAGQDKVALILDGLDEMDEALRPAALQALSDAPCRVVVLTRSQAMVEAASKAWLVGAVAVHLHEVTGPEAADYLQRARTGPPPSGWAGLLAHLPQHTDGLLAHLREHPVGVLARGLSTPLTLTLIRDTYQASDNVSELFDATRYRSTEAIEQHLIARVLPAAYTRRPGRPSPRYSEEQARQALTFIARKMGKERDLAWWRIPSWAPVTPRILATGLGVRLVSGLVSGLGIVVEFVSGLGLRYGLMVGLGVGLGYVLINMFFEGGASEDSPLGPREIWRNDRMAGLVGGLGAVPGVGLGVALTSPEIWPTTLAWLQLRRSGHVPAVSLMLFLEDARQRGVLRTVGGVYQFRHATLQDQLAG